MVSAAGVRPVDADVRAVVAEVPDPELPVLTIDDLGILRDVTVGDVGGTILKFQVLPIGGDVAGGGSD